MKKNVSKKSLLAVISLVLLAAMLVSSVATAQGGKPNEIAEVAVQTSSITWTPLVDGFKGMTLTITGPGGFYFQEKYANSASPTLASGDFGDGAYLYELVLWPDISREAEADQALRGLASQLPSAMTQSGAFTVQGGAFVTAATEPDQTEPNNTGAEGIAPLDAVTADDAIITGSICLGFDCLIDGTENFGYDTMKLKENNLQIYFDDTSATAGFPANDWRIITNDSSSGGANYFKVQDSTASTDPFKIMAGAPSNSLFVSPMGKLGLGTSTPVLNIHTISGDTPGLRLEQNATIGWTPQTWDLAGNETNFFIRDVTSGGLLPFRIRPGAPTSSIDISPSGKVGIGTASPLYNLDVAATDADTSLGVRRTAGATVKLNATAEAGTVGTENAFPLQFQVNNLTQMTLTNAGNLGLGTSAPAYNLEVAQTGANASLGVRRIDGATIKLNATAGAGTVGTENAFPLQFQANGLTQMTLTNAGNLGLGTDLPAYSLEVERTGANASLGVQRVGGATVKLAADTKRGIIGTANKFKLEFWVNNAPKMTLATNGSLTVKGRVNATGFNVVSDVNAKENFAPINQAAVLERLASIPISTWNYIENDDKVMHMGPMAQDFYAAFGLGADNKHISTVDADGVALAAIQELNQRNETLTSENASLRTQVEALAARISALENTAPSGQASPTGLIILVTLLVCVNLGLIAVLAWAIRRGSFPGLKPAG